jgi:L-2-hydroxyglutarate oxidase
MTKRAFLHDADDDVPDIGGGIVGVSTAMQLTERDPSRKVVLVEKENLFAAHQSGHTTGV